MREYKVLETRPFVSALLEENEIVFFVGSGISMRDPSNLPTGYELKRNLFKGITSHKDLSVYFDGIYGSSLFCMGNSISLLSAEEDYMRGMLNVERP